MSNESLEARMQAVEDRIAIIDLLCRYAVSIDRHQWDQWASCFADEIDVNLIRTGRWVHFERSDLVALVRTVFESYSATQHVSANHQVSVTGDTAVAWSTLNATHYLKDTPEGAFHQQVGYYEHHLARFDDGWRLTRLRQVEHWQRGNQQIFDRTVQ